QTIVPERLVSINQTNRIKQLERFSLSYNEFEKLAKVAERENILFLSTPFDIESARFLEPLVPAFKIASSDNTFYPLIEEIASTGKPIIISTGLANLNDIVKTRDYIYRIWGKEGGQQEMAFLHCVSCYPTPPSDANLLAIRSLKQLGTTVGYSDHTLGIDAAVLSVALGARIIEKHFTLDKNFSDYRDHSLSADPTELALLIKKVKTAETLLGNGGKHLEDCEAGNVELIRRSIVACDYLEKGTVITWEHLNWVRPGYGLSPGNEEQLIGKRLKQSMKQGEMILPDHVKPIEDSK
ncbi:N-acetylneuraminate synthase family protein, partial [Thermodesulfobacteriota bacterium]